MHFFKPNFLDSLSGLSGQGHQQHRGVEPLHEDRQLVQTRKEKVQVTLKMGQTIQMPG